MWDNVLKGGRSTRRLSADPGGILTIGLVLCSSSDFIKAQIVCMFMCK